MILAASRPTALLDDVRDGDASKQRDAEDRNGEIVVHLLTFVRTAAAKQQSGNGFYVRPENDRGNNESDDQEPDERGGHSEGHHQTAWIRAPVQAQGVEQLFEWAWSVASAFGRGNA